MHLITDWSAVVANRRRKQPSTEGGFGPRLAEFRQSRGLTQEELGERLGLSNRMVAYYERDEASPPGPILAALAQALDVSTDELLAVKPPADRRGKKSARLLKRLQRIEELPPADQRAVLKFVDALVQSRRRSA